MRVRVLSMGRRMGLFWRAFDDKLYADDCEAILKLIPVSDLVVVVAYEPVYISSAVDMDLVATPLD
jgi:hypothetical protein